MPILLAKSNILFQMNYFNVYGIHIQSIDTPKNRRVVFDVLPFTMLASSVNGKTSKKRCKNDAAVLGVSRPLKFELSLLKA